ncbi:cobaltochelatase subunit CobN [Marinibacterium sp. SX1]|uniref:cobaltochelatase subunit CobN n=1 Tax=Marinibacterium sp. SX1 TaxID=3388424 RepID=UPI003D1812AE
MHVVFRERQGLEEGDTPVDLDQSPAELVVLSFSDSDLGAFAAGWHRARQAAGGDDERAATGTGGGNDGATTVTGGCRDGAPPAVAETGGRGGDGAVADTGGQGGGTPAAMDTATPGDSDNRAATETDLRGGDGAAGKIPALRLANLSALTHPLSVDTYVEKTLSGARAVLVRLIGGVPYWRYGLDQLRDLAARQGLAVAVLPADGRADPALDAYSTLPVSTLRRLQHLCDEGGAVAAQAALAQLALSAGIYMAPVPGEKRLPQMGAWTPEAGVFGLDDNGPATLAAHGTGSTLATNETGRTRATDGPADAIATDEPGQPEPSADAPSPRTRILVVFYRSYVAAADLGPVEALFAAFRQRGCEVAGLFAPSLKAPEAAAWLEARVAEWGPAAIINVTAFSGRGAAGRSPLDIAGVPVFQATLATSSRADWAGAERGLLPADLAMHVVLPEVDGRIGGGVVSFKEPGPRDPALEFARVAHVADAGRVAALADRVMGWVGLQQGHDGAVALVLSTYPGKDWQLGHAVGLDAPASARAMLEDLGLTPPADLAKALQDGRQRFGLDAYHAALAALPDEMRAELDRAHGPAANDPAVRDGAFEFAALALGPTVVALQPERGDAAGREDEYHDLARVPRHGYVAFYLWLRHRVRAMVHIGAHGTLEWLPGKAVALSDTCWPEALLGDLPVIYPFIVNDPGEAAQAKRRIGAVTIGHVPPPLKDSGTPERLARLEALLDEFSNADGLDPRRRDALQDDIRDEARALGLEADLGLDPGAGPAEAIGRIDRFVCDVKDSQFGDGLHVFGRAPEAARDGASQTGAVRAEAAQVEAVTEGIGQVGTARDGTAPVKASRGETAQKGTPQVEAAQQGPTQSGVAHERNSQVEAARASAVQTGMATEQTSQAGAAQVGTLQDRAAKDGAFDVAPSARAERAALGHALAGRFVAPGPSGSPYRGRRDVLPTGRNLFTTDPRSVPTRAAWRQGRRLADELVRRHLQDDGDWPRGVVVDLWGSATMRTAGEEFAMALALIGVRPCWDEGSERVSGIEAVPLTEMDRPRIDVTLRVSGLFRDVFPSLAGLFGQAVRMLAGRDEAADFNPYVTGAGTGGPRVYGPAPGSYGLGLGDLPEQYGAEARARAGEAWLAASAWALDGAQNGADAVHDPAGIRARVAGADAFVHLQDLAESDLLLAADYAAHEAGFAAAQAVAQDGADQQAPARLWHLDNTDPDRVRVRALGEEIARVVQARASHPGWIAGMQRHGFRGAAEIAATLDHMAAFAQLAGVVGDHLFDLYFDATLGDDRVAAFLAEANPRAHAAMWDRFRALDAAGLWATRRNAIRAALEGVA